MTALTADPALPASQQLHAEQGEQTGDEVVQHDAEPAVDTAIEPGDGPGLEHIEQPEQHEAGQHPVAGGVLDPQVFDFKQGHGYLCGGHPSQIIRP